MKWHGGLQMAPRRTRSTTSSLRKGTFHHCWTSKDEVQTLLNHSCLSYLESQASWRLPSQEDWAGPYTWYGTRPDAPELFSMHNPTWSHELTDHEVSGSTIWRQIWEDVRSWAGSRRRMTVQYEIVFVKKTMTHLRSLWCKYFISMQQNMTCQ